MPPIAVNEPHSCLTGSSSVGDVFFSAHTFFFTTVPAPFSVTVTSISGHSETVASHFVVSAHLIRGPDGSKSLTQSAQATHSYDFELSNLELKAQAKSVLHGDVHVVKQFIFSSH